MQPRLIRFPPVPLKARHDGWTPERQFRFIAELAATRSITRACAAVGMSREGAYTLRDHPGATSGFAIAWREALRADFAVERHKAPRSPRAAQRLSKLTARKVDEATETHDPPDSRFPHLRTVNFVDFDSFDAGIVAQPRPRPAALRSAPAPKREPLPPESSFLSALRDVSDVRAAARVEGDESCVFG